MGVMQNMKSKKYLGDIRKVQENNNIDKVEDVEQRHGGLGGHLLIIS